MSIHLARKTAEELVARLGFEKPPIDVDKVARSLGLRVGRGNLGAGISGLLVRNADGAFVCVQETDSRARQRFTLGHEIGHHFLRHQFEAGAHVHVDRGNFISQRGPRASAGVDPKEIDANQFAAALLMPSRMLRKRATEIVGDGPLHDGDVAALADEFDVSEQAMTIRLTALGIL